MNISISEHSIQFSQEIKNYICLLKNHHIFCVFNVKPEEGKKLKSNFSRLKLLDFLYSITSLDNLGFNILFVSSSIHHTCRNNNFWIFLSRLLIRNWNNKSTHRKVPNSIYERVIPQNNNRLRLFFKKLKTVKRSACFINMVISCIITGCGYRWNCLNHLSTWHFLSLTGRKG